jgi:sialic acid synthase SpsE
MTSTKSEYYEIFKNLEFSLSDFQELSNYAKKQKLIFCSTPFSEKAVDILEKCKVPFFKIASGDLTHTPLLKYVASKKKPVIISTGMSNMEEIKNAIKVIESQDNNKIVILHSVSAYPTPQNETNLNAIKTLEKKFVYPIGFSDNGPGITVPISAMCLGARVIEKHFTLNKKMKGPDHSFSGDPKDFKKMIEKIREIESILGNGVKTPQKSEFGNIINIRRSITSKMEINRGQRITKDMLSIKRPATGIEPKFLDKIIGEKVKKRIEIDRAIKWDDLE